MLPLEHSAILLAYSLENHFFVFWRVAVLYRFYCILIIAHQDGCQSGRSRSVCTCGHLVILPNFIYGLLMSLSCPSSWFLSDESSPSWLLPDCTLGNLSTFINVTQVQKCFSNAFFTERHYVGPFCYSPDSSS